MSRTPLNVDNETEWEDLVSNLLLDDAMAGGNSLNDLRQTWGGRGLGTRPGVPGDRLDVMAEPPGFSARAVEPPHASGHHFQGPTYQAAQHERAARAFHGHVHQHGTSPQAHQSSQAAASGQRLPRHLQTMTDQGQSLFSAPPRQPISLHQASPQADSSISGSQPASPRGLDIEDLFSAGVSGARASSAASSEQVADFAYQSDRDYTSRTLFVRNISSNTEDSELVDLFGSYGDIRDMYSACKYRGFVMISFFDERSAIAAMDCLQGKSLRRRKMDIHFSIPKENQTDAGMLLLFNMEQSMPNTVIANLFQAFGEIKAIQSLHISSGQTHQSGRTTVRMIEYYDERHAATALKALNNTELWNRRIRIQFGRIGRTQKQQRVQHGAPGYAAAVASQSIAPDNEFGVCDLHASPPPQQQHHHHHHNRGVYAPALGVQAEQAGPSGQYSGQRARYGGHGGGYHDQQQQHDRYGYGRGGGLQQKGRGGGDSSHHKSKKNSHFSLNLQSIAEGKDRKTTVMIRNIPNKYTQRMLLAEVDTELKGKYDFFYLPIDFKNQCNVGYAFINLTDPLWILNLYEKFNGKRWSHFNSGKICEITYARIQGKQALVAHFRHSTLMQVDESCQPLLLNENQEIEEIFAASDGSGQGGRREGGHHRRGNHAGQGGGGGRGQHRAGGGKQKRAEVDDLKSDSGSPPQLEVAT